MAKSARIVIACLLLVAVSSCEAIPADSLLSHWTSFKAQHGKEYASQAEEAKRIELFARNKLQVDRFNQEQSQEAGYTLEVNHLSDRTDEEFKQLLGFKMTPEQMDQVSSEGLRGSLSSILGSNGIVLPDSVDWRMFGRVSPVKNQHQCGSCWAFSTAGVLEGQELQRDPTGRLVSVSSQNIMDCGSFAADPCNGGDMAQALVDIAAKGGVESDEHYPYQGAQESCKYNKTLSVITNKSAMVYRCSEEVLQAIVAEYGPVAVGIEVSEGAEFRSYKSGVYTDKNCHDDPKYLNHAVLIVGYGTDPQGGDYWIVKNSWSSTWGEEGYIRMARNRNNMCGIATYPVIATF